MIVDEFDIFYGAAYKLLMKKYLDNTCLKEAQKKDINWFAKS